jgi:hypothetical protein
LCHQFVLPKEDLCATQRVIENTSRPRNPFEVKRLDKFSAMTGHMFRLTVRVKAAGLSRRPLNLLVSISLFFRYYQHFKIFG